MMSPVRNRHRRLGAPWREKTLRDQHMRRRDLQFEREVDFQALRSPTQNFDIEADFLGNLRL